MEASGDRLASSTGHLPGSPLVPASSVSVGMGSSRKSHHTYKNPSKTSFCLPALLR